MNGTVDLTNEASAIVDTYLQPGLSTEVNLPEDLRKSIKAMVSGMVVASEQDLLGAFEEAQHETVRIMATEAFPRFIQSPGFIKYRTLNHITDPEIQIKMTNELDDLLQNTSWLSHLLSSVEKLPVCVSLAAANKMLSGFPLIYVNAAFETTTGYPREEIIGQNCRFLQMGKVAGHISEVESIQLMSTALREGRQVKVAITNFKKDGTTFRNLLAMKPIFDLKGRYAFVLGIQFDIGDGKASPKKMRIIDDLFRVLPNTITALSSSM
jgi:PAS domain S-box-containing protein